MIDIKITLTALIITIVAGMLSELHELFGLVAFASGVVTVIGLIQYIWYML